MISQDRLLILLGLNHLLNNSLFKDYDLTRQTTDTTGFKPFTEQQSF